LRGHAGKVEEGGRRKGKSVISRNVGRPGESCPVTTSPFLGETVKTYREVGK